MRLAISTKYKMPKTPHAKVLSYCNLERAKVSAICLTRGLKIEGSICSKLPGTTRFLSQRSPHLRLSLGFPNHFFANLLRHILPEMLPGWPRELPKISTVAVPNLLRCISFIVDCSMAGFINVSSFSNRYLIEVSNIQLTLKAGTIDGKLGVLRPRNSANT